MKYNVLVFPAGSEIGLEIYRSLHLSTHFSIFGGSSVPDHARFVYRNYIENIPHVDEGSFIDRLNGIIDQNKIDFVFPAHDSVAVKLARAKSDGSLRCKVVGSPLATCEIARSKRKTLETFQQLLPTPKLYKDVQELTQKDFPIFMKPDIGQGSKGTFLAKTLEDVTFYLQQDPTLLMLEYLPGKEYTVDCFTNKDGKLLFSEGRERKRISNGISVSSETVNDERFTRMAHTINAQLQFRGVWFFQVKENNDNELILMEIAPRVAGTMGLVRSKGVNLALLSLFDALGQDVTIFENNYNITIDRALYNLYHHDLSYKHVYLDFDDLVIFEGQVNPMVMAFVYQCMNKKIKIHLLTKHKKQLEDSLKQYRLTSVFDDLIWIQDDTEKYSYITEKDAIFIDDSFAERKMVYEKRKIPVFDAHMIESLIEKF